MHRPAREIPRIPEGAANKRNDRVEPGVRRKAGGMGVSRGAFDCGSYPLPLRDDVVEHFAEEILEAAMVKVRVSTLRVGLTAS